MLFILLATLNLVRFSIQELPITPLQGWRYVVRVLTEDDHPDMPLYLNDLVTGLGHRFSELGHTEDLEEAYDLADRQSLQVETSISDGLLVTRLLPPCLRRSS